MIPTNLIESELLAIRFVSDTTAKTSKVIFDFAAGRCTITATGDTPLRLDFESQTAEGVKIDVVLGA